MGDGEDKLNKTYIHGKWDRNKLFYHYRTTGFRDRTLLPLLLCWKTITDVRAHGKQSPMEHGVTQGQSCTISNLLRNPKSHIKQFGHVATFPLCSKLAVTSIVSLHCASPWIPQNPLSLELPGIMMYQGMTGHL